MSPTLLREIAAEQLRVGMVVERMDLPWIRNPFWRSRVVVKDLATLRTLIATGCKRFWVDHAIVDAASDVATTAIRAQVEPSDDPQAASASTALMHDPAAAAMDTSSLSVTDNEMTAAIGIRDRAKDLIIRLHEQVKNGEPPRLDQVVGVTAEIESSLLRNRSALTSLMRLKSQDDYTFLHSVAVCTLMVSLAMELKLSAEDTRLAGLGGLLHDLGKALVPLEILNKPGQLMPEEFDIVRGHARLGADLLTRAGQFPSEVIDMVAHHHERQDGKGYPDRLDAAAISTFAGMATVCDVYDALTSDRVYKKAWTPAIALSEMAKMRAGVFDEATFQAFVRSMGIYPIGSLVRMPDQLLAVVVCQSTSNLLAPIVKPVFDIAADAAIDSDEVDLSAPPYAGMSLRREDPAQWPGLPPLEDVWLQRAATYAPIRA